MVSHKTDIQDENIRNRKVIFITSLYGSSNGSAFANTLFDDHPEIHTFPHALTTCISVQDFESKCKQEHVDRILSDPVFFDSSLGDARVRGDGFHTLGANKDQGYQIDRGVFEEELVRMITRHEWSLGSFIAMVVLAFESARAKEINSNTFVIYAHDFETILALDGQFEDYSVLALCRHPYNVFVSLCRQSAQRSIDRSLLATSPSYAFLKTFDEFTKLRRPILVLCLEQLHSAPRDSMRAVAAALGIRFSERLLESTVCGLKWWGIRVSILNGFSKTLHRDLNVSEGGRNAEAAIFKATKNLCKFIGYRREDLKHQERLRAFFPGRAHFAYFPKAAVQLRALLARESNCNLRLYLVMRFLKNTAIFFALRLIEQWWLFNVKKKDEAIPYSEHLVVINPPMGDAFRPNAS